MILAIVIIGLITVLNSAIIYLLMRGQAYLIEKMDDIADAQIDNSVIVLERLQELTNEIENIKNK